MPSPLRNQTDEEVAEWYWSLPYHEWHKLDDPELVDHIKDLFTELFLKETRLGADRAPVVRRHLHVGEGFEPIGGPYICATFSLVGTTYFYYDDRSDRQALDEWISELAENQAGNYETERDELGFTELEDWGGWK